MLSHVLLSMRWILILSVILTTSVLLASTSVAVESSSRSREAVMAVVHQHGQGIRRCYEQGLTGRMPPGTHGRLVYRVTIDERGRVQNVRAAARESDRAMIRIDWLVDCIAQQIRRLDFGPGEATTVSVPLTFRPAG